MILTIHTDDTLIEKDLLTEALDTKLFVVVQDIKKYLIELTGNCVYNENKRMVG